MSDLFKAGIFKMNLDKKTIENYFSGYLEAEFENGYYFLYRFGIEQRSFYTKEGGFYGNQSHYQAGIKINVDNCTEISFDFVIRSEGTEEISFGAVYADGREENYRFDSSIQKAVFSFKGESVNVYFPYNARIGIKNIEICGDIPMKTERNILSFGDSITQGYMITEAALAYPSVLGRAFKADVYNFGIGGYFIRSGILNELDKLPRPWIITFAYGTNDWHFEQDYKKELPDIFRRIHNKYPDTPVFVILPITRRNESMRRSSGFLENVRNDLEDEAAKYHNFYVISSGKKLDAGAHLFDDGIHPNNDGMRYLGRLIAEDIAEIVE